MPSSSMPWIKLYVETVDDPKMGRLSDRLWRRAVELFMLAGRTGAGGYLPPLTDMAWVLRMNEDELTEDLEELAKVNIVQHTEDGWFVTHFAERQDADSNAERQRRYRERKHHALYTGETQPLQEASQSNDEGITKSNDTHNDPSRRLREEEEEEKESRGKTPQVETPEKGAKAPVARSATKPARRDELRIDLTEQGRTLQTILDKAFTGTSKRVPVYYANTAQRDAYLSVFTRLNSTLSDMITKGIQREITERSKLLSWLQGCAKKAGLDEVYEKREPPQLTPDEWAAQHLAGLGSDITEYVR